MNEWTPMYINMKYFQNSCQKVLKFDMGVGHFPEDDFTDNVLIDSDLTDKKFFHNKL
jgi:hypothetical protein